MDSDPAAVERNIKRLQEEQRKSKNQDMAVIKNLLSATFEKRSQELLQVSDGKTRVSNALKEWHIIDKEIYVCRTIQPIYRNFIVSQFTAKP